MFVRFEEAENDCMEALNLDDRYVKAYSRRATARKELGKLKASLEGIREYVWSLVVLISSSCILNSVILFLELVILKF